MIRPPFVCESGRFIGSRSAAALRLPLIERFMRILRDVGLCRAATAQTVVQADLLPAPAVSWPVMRQEIVYAAHGPNGSWVQKAMTPCWHAQTTCRTISPKSSVKSNARVWLKKQIKNMSECQRLGFRSQPKTNRKTRKTENANNSRALWC